MKFVYAIVVLMLVGIAFSWAAIPPAMKVPEGPSPEMVKKMNAIDPQFQPYSTMCFKGKKMIYMFRGAFYELDDNGKPIPCVK